MFVFLSVVFYSLALLCEIQEKLCQTHRLALGFYKLRKLHLNYPSLLYLGVYVN